jgi:hypothetical protein
LITTGCYLKNCQKIYYIKYIPESKINLDGNLEESDWLKANLEVGFTFPWEERSVPLTEFRAFVNDKHFYFSFNVHDSEVIFDEEFTNESALDREDRVEFYFTPDETLKKYFCIEIDPLGRVHDYIASYYRRFDSSWDCSGIITAGRLTERGYTIEGKIPLKTLDELGLPSFNSEKPLVTGIFRAVFKYGLDNKIGEHWISWIDPKTRKPDFHVSSSFGCLQIISEAHQL